MNVVDSDTRNLSEWSSRLWSRFSARVSNVDLRLVP